MFGTFEIQGVSRVSSLGIVIMVFSRCHVFRVLGPLLGNVRLGSTCWRVSRSRGLDHKAQVALGILL